ncbi:Dihydroorotate dehydrogenase B (NAD(+)), catalytic subunit [Phycisphaerae bacterium RAS1]|nr:Dihydroorotate dehydrogenase B (NAD(+)), catalytic subunit [Phycisphaerae bacterium RAS1]
MTAAADPPTDPRLTVHLAGIPLRTPVLTASGTCGYGPEYADVLDYRRLGAFTTKSVTLSERPGNEPQRIAEVRGGLLNAIGLANVGLKRFIAEKVPFIQSMPTPVLVNVAGYRVEDYVAVCEAIDPIPCIAGIELNVSCPNVADGLMFGTDPRLMEQVVSAVRRVIRRGKLLVKLSPNVTDITVMARAALAGGADGLSLINTYVGLAIDARTWKPVLANVTGGLSGPAIKPLALFNIHRVYREVTKSAGVPILGMGGIQCTADAIEFLLAGASAVAIGTALFVDPSLPAKIADGLSRYVEQHGLSNVTQLVGALKLPENPMPKPSVQRG